MSVFKRKRAGKSSKMVADKTWSVDFRDHGDILRRLSGFTDRSATVELERHLMRLIALRLAGAGPDAELSRFLEGCPERILCKLGEWGIIAAERAAGSKPLVGLVDAWETHLRSRQLSESHCRESAANVLRVLRETGVKYWTDFTADKVEAWLVNFRKAGTSNRTSNSYLSKLKTFANWMVATGSASVNPIARLRKLNEAADRRYERHPTVHDYFLEIPL